MKYIIPYFIQEACHRKEKYGYNHSFGMFIDMAGFTVMTETLIQGGEEGAEILSDIINGIFEPLVDSIYRRNGFISTYAGDAFTALYPDEDDSRAEDVYAQALQVIFCAQEIQAIVQMFGHHDTEYGTINLQAKVGLS